MLQKYCIVLALLFLLSISCKNATEAYYKELDTGEKLQLKIYHPQNFDSDQRYPTIVFFHGGGWRNGDIGHFRPYAKEFVKKGMIALLIEYRQQETHGTTPFEALMDAKSAMRYVKEHADEIGVDTTKIVASGASTGGHLAAATSMIDGYNDDKDNLAISPTSNALVLFNPMIDNGPGGYGYKRIGEEYVDFSPMHNIKSNVPPTLFFIGSLDSHIPITTAKSYKSEIEKVHGRCDLIIYEGETHGFFNPDHGVENFEKTLQQTFDFLNSLDILK